MVSLRSWQVSALAAFRANGNQGCFEVATGGGKTFFAITALIELWKESPELRSLVIVPTQALLDQWYLSFVDDFRFSEEQIKILSGSDLVPDARINIVVINTARKFNNFLPNAKDVVLVVDECHRAGSVENAKSLVAGCAATIGLSATPFREYDEGFEQRVQPVLGSIVATYTLADAIADGVLSKLTLRNIDIPLLPSEQNDYDRISRRIGMAFGRGESEDHIRALMVARARISNNAFYRVPVARSLVMDYSGKRILVFLESINAAETLFNLLNAEGVSVCVYHSKMGPHLRRANLRGFRKGIFDVLIACRALDEGFNVPEAEVAIIAAGTASKRQRIQRIGRVLRTFAGKSKGTVVTLYATKHEEKRLQEECDEFAKFVHVEWGKVSLG